MSGIEARAGSQIEVIRLDLLSAIGRRVAREFGVRLVPLTLLFDGQGGLILRQSGMPDANKLMAAIADLP